MAQIAASVTQWPADIMENYRWLDESLQSQKATVKEFQPAWQAFKYMLRGKMYAYIGVNDQNNRPIITMKLEPAYSDLLRHEYADIEPGYYMNKTHWSTVYLDGEVPYDVVIHMVSAAYALMFSSLSKKVQREISL